MGKQNFTYGPIAIGIYKAMIWLVVLITFTAPWLLIFYIPLLLFLGFGLRPFLISTGLYQHLQILAGKRDDIKNEQLKKANYKRNSDRINQKTAHIDAMRKKMSSKIK